VLQTAAFKPVALSAPEYSLGPPAFDQPRAREIPELIAMMLEAVSAAPNSSRTLHKIFTAQFEGRQVSTGRRIGKELAKHMATCCRAAIMMEGGNPYQGSPSPSDPVTR
jgi:hypothetical protein